MWVGLLDQVVRGLQLGGIHRVSEEGHWHHRDWQHESLLSWRVLSVAKQQLEQRTEGGDGQQGRAGQVRAGALLEGEGGPDGVEEGPVHTGIMAPGLPCGETKGPEQGIKIEC